jgi:hypothetical protein
VPLAQRNAPQHGYFYSQKSPKDRELINQQFCFPEGAHDRAPVPKVWILLNPHS